jgi:hypothetical protein
MNRNVGPIGFVEFLSVLASIFKIWPDANEKPGKKQTHGRRIERRA